MASFGSKLLLLPSSGPMRPHSYASLSLMRPSGFPNPRSEQGTIAYSHATMSSRYAASFWLMEHRMCLAKSRSSRHTAQLTSIGKAFVLPNCLLRVDRFSISTCPGFKKMDIWLSRSRMFGTWWCSAAKLMSSSAVAAPATCTLVTLCRVTALHVRLSSRSGSVDEDRGTSERCG